MLAKLTGIDEFILDRLYQKFSDFCHKHFGISCFVLAHISLVTSCMLYVGYPLFKYAVFQQKINELPTICMMMVIYVVIYVSHVLHANNYRHGHGNDNRMRGQFSRVVMAFLTILNFLLPSCPMVRCLDITMYTSALYFIACVPLPPQKSTVRLFLEKLVPQPAEAAPVTVRH